MASRPVCGELLIFPESAIRHTQVSRLRTDRFVSRRFTRAAQMAK